MITARRPGSTPGLVLGLINRLNVLVRTADRRLVRYDVLMWWMGRGLQWWKLIKRNYGEILVAMNLRSLLAQNHTCDTSLMWRDLRLRTSQSSGTLGESVSDSTGTTSHTGASKLTELWLNWNEPMGGVKLFIPLATRFLTSETSFRVVWSVSKLETFT